MPEYWVADRIEKAVHRFLFAEGDEARRVEGTLQWHPSGAPAALTIDLSRALADF